MIIVAPFVFLQSIYFEVLKCVTSQFRFGNLPFTFLGAIDD